jgi:hypothetical protein
MRSLTSFHLCCTLSVWLPIREYLWDYMDKGANFCHCSERVSSCSNMDLQNLYDGKCSMETDSEGKGRACLFANGCFCS